MDNDEKILAHLVSVWREEKKFLSIGGKEGMLFLTDRHLMFVRKTQAKKKWWGAVTQRQVLTLIKTNNTMIRHDGYNEESLRLDLENKKNVEIPFNNILKIESEERTWGTVLLLKIKENGKNKSYEFSIVQDWVKYPMKDPIKYMKVDWLPIIQYIKDTQN